MFLYYVSLYTALLARPWTRCKGHTRQRDVWAGEAETRVRALHNTHGTAGSRRADCRRLHLHRLQSGNKYIAHCERRPARYPPPGWRRATTVEASAITRRRVTHSSERWDCTHIERDEHDPISRGAAEQAARTDQHTGHAGPTWTRPDRGTSGWTPGLGRHTCTYKVSKAGRPRSHLWRADRG